MIQFKKIILLLFLIGTVDTTFAQNASSTVLAKEIMQKVSARYKSFKAVDLSFSLTTIKPKIKAEDPDSKYTSTESGKLYLKGNKFKIALAGHEIICDSKTIWNYSAAEKEVQVNEYEESENVFSPTKIFNMHLEGYIYQIKERKTFQGKSTTVIELTPINKKVSYFKIDVAVEDNTNNILEAKIYEKSGSRYVYTITKQNGAVSLADDFFSFDIKKYPGVNAVDLR